jgi:ABC-type phosphate/phosphonate transport system substrate-binding protein
MERKGYITKADYKILWTSGNYPSTPICIRSDLPESFKQKVKQSLLDLPRKDPKTWKAFQDKALLYFADSIRNKIIMVPCNDSIYNPIREMAKKVKSVNFGLK